MSRAEPSPEEPSPEEPTRPTRPTSAEPPRTALAEATRRSLPRAALLALAMHGAAAGLLLLAPPPSAPQVATREREEARQPALEISLDDGVPPPGPSAAAAAPATAAAPPPAGRGDHARGPARAADLGADVSSAAAGAAAASAAASAETAVGAGTAATAEPAQGAASASALVLVRPPVVVGGPNPFLAPGALPGQPLAREGGGSSAADATAEANRRVERALREPARERERELGLGPDGPVLAALGEATSGGTAPVNGRALFLATANGAGEVVAIDVLSCDGARVAWAAAATDALGALRGKKLRMPSSAKGAEMKIEVTSAWKLPSGHDPGAEVSVLGLTAKKGEGKRSTKVTILDPIPKLRVVELAKDVKIPVPQIGVTLFATDADPADAAAKPRRVVHTRLVESKIL